MHVTAVDRYVRVVEMEANYMPMSCAAEALRRVGTSATRATPRSTVATKEYYCAENRMSPNYLAAARVGATRAPSLMACNFPVGSLDEGAAIRASVRNKIPPTITTDLYLQQKSKHCTST